MQQQRQEEVEKIAKKTAEDIQNDLASSSDDSSDQEFNYLVPIKQDCAEEHSESSDKEQVNEHKTFTVFQNITQLKLNEPFLNSGLLENDDTQDVNVKTAFATLVGHAK